MPARCCREPMKQDVIGRRCSQERGEASLPRKGSQHQTIDLAVDLGSEADERQPAWHRQNAIRMRPETQRQQIEQALQQWPASLQYATDRVQAT